MRVGTVQSLSFLLPCSSTCLVLITDQVGSYLLYTCLVTRNSPSTRVLATPPADLEAVHTVAGAATDNNNNTVTAAAEAESVDGANLGSNDVREEGDKSPINTGGDTDKDILANAAEIADEPCEIMKVTNRTEFTPPQEDRVPALPTPSSPAMCQTANVSSSSSTNIRSDDLRCLETENTSSVALTSVTEITESSTQINVTQSWQEGTTSDHVSLYPEDVRQGVVPQLDGEMSTSVESAEKPNLGNDLAENFPGHEASVSSISISPAEEVTAALPTIPVKSGQEASINETFMGGEERGRECREECGEATTEKVDKVAIYGNKTDAEISDSPSALSNRQKQSAQENCKLIVCR